MLGQWVGQLTEGTNKGFCALNFERRSPSSGMVMFVDSDPNLMPLPMWARLSFTITNESINGKLSNYLIFDSKNNLVRSEDLVVKDIRTPISGEVKAILKDGLLTGEFKTDIGTYGKFILKETDKKEFDTKEHRFKDIHSAYPVIEKFLKRCEELNIMENKHNFNLQSN